MRIIATMLFLIISSQASAFSMMSTKEKVRLELWFGGINSSVKKNVPKKSSSQRLPPELEHALSKL